MPFPSKLKKDALVACGRCCCICHKFCGLKIEVHHIREESDGGESSAENAIPLCFNCHADMRSYDHKHPKGNKYSESELKGHRDSWYDKVKGNIGLADREAVIDTDKEVYKVLLNVLPWEGSVTFITGQSFERSFERARILDLHEFSYLCEKPAFEFLDPDLEALRARLLELIEEFTGTIASDTWTTDRTERNEVPEEWEYEQPERYEKVVSKLHDRAAKIAEVYGSLIRTATRKLGVLPPLVAEASKS